MNNEKNINEYFIINNQNCIYYIYLGYLKFTSMIIHYKLFNINLRR